MCNIDLVPFEITYCLHVSVKMFSFFYKAMCVIDDIFGVTVNLDEMGKSDLHIKLIKYKHTGPRNSNILESLEKMLTSLIYSNIC